MLTFSSMSLLWRWNECLFERSPQDIFCEDERLFDADENCIVPIHCHRELNYCAWPELLFSCTIFLWAKRANKRLLGGSQICQSWKI